MGKGSIFRKADQTSGCEKIREQLDELSPQNSYDFFNENINKFLVANRHRYDYITNEAMEYIRTMAEGVSLTEMFVSFSGGKDSTVVSDLVLRALGNPAGIAFIRAIQRWNSQNLRNT